MGDGLRVTIPSGHVMEPPMVLFAVPHTSGTHPLLYSRDHVAINILSAANSEVVKAFASKGTDKFAGVQWRRGPFGSPLIERASAQIEVVVRERIQASTHTLFVARVLHAEHFDEPPLVYFAGQFASSVNLRGTVETS